MKIRNPLEFVRHILRFGMHARITGDKDVLETMLKNIAEWKDFYIQKVVDPKVIEDLTTSILIAVIRHPYITAGLLYSSVISCVNSLPVTNSGLIILAQSIVSSWPTE